MVWQSIIFMFWCAMGTFQMIASWASLYGLSFFRKVPVIGYAFGAANIVAAFIWFFSSIDIGENGARGQHYEQFVSVVLGVGSAALVTGVISSLINIGLSRQPEENPPASGLESFQTRTLLSLMSAYLKNKSGGRG